MVVNTVILNEAKHCMHKVHLEEVEKKMLCCLNLRRFMRQSKSKVIFLRVIIDAYEMMRAHTTGSIRNQLKWRSRTVNKKAKLSFDVLEEDNVSADHYTVHVKMILYCPIIKSKEGLSNTAVEQAEHWDQKISLSRRDNSPLQPLRRIWHKIQMNRI